MPLLLEIYTEVQHRTEAMSVDAPEWPCRAGCDHCCRHLPSLPDATAAEWRYFDEGLQSLSAKIQAAVQKRVFEKCNRQEPITCPALDEPSGRCLVYTHRPAACRSYGYYRTRAHDAWCGKVSAHVEGRPPIVFGNQDALDRRLGHDFGPRIPMDQWFSKQG